MSSIKLILGDCLQELKKLSDNSVDLIIIDPPYNIKKDKWDKINGYLDWCVLWLNESQRILKDNGSFYMFHNQMPTIIKLMDWLETRTPFIFKQFIVWNKRFKGNKYKNYLDGYVAIKGDRNYRLMAEYILFYTFQDETGLTTVMLDTNNFSTLRQYFKEYQEALGLNKKQIIEKIGQRADHCFRWKSSQWDLPTKETYEALSKIPLKYEFVRREYEDVRREYEDLRYTFNNQKTHHSIWNYGIEKKQGHITPKPLELIKNIIRHSSNEGDMVLDFFLGSGTTGLACKELGREFIGIEKEEEYIEIAKRRIEATKQDKQQKLF